MPHLLQNQFLRRAKQRHGQRYDYSLVEYTRLTDTITIVCPVHGPFYQTAGNHLRAGCRVCGVKQAGQTLTTRHKQSPDHVKRERNKKAFLKRAISVHGSTYDYSRVVYINTGSKIEVLCRKHGGFWVTPDNHLKAGCPKCGTERRKLLTENSKPDRLNAFIRRATLRHGQQFGYTLVKYINAHTPITIVCPVHGEFQQTPDSHLAHGCKRCTHRGSKAESRRTRRAQLVAETKETVFRKYGGTLDLSSLQPNNVLRTFSVRCAVHGSFTTTKSRLILRGCDSCRNLGMQQRQYDSFIRKATQRHANKYDYSAITPDSFKRVFRAKCSKHGAFEASRKAIENRRCPACLTESKALGGAQAVKAGDPRRPLAHVRLTDIGEGVLLSIMCPTHGEFSQLPKNHLRCGCPKCGIDSYASSQRMSEVEFMERVKAIHGSRYDYHTLNYRSFHTKLAVVCPKHGPFDISPAHLLEGNGCGRCGRDKAADKLRCTAVDFISQSRAVHGDRYDYSEVRYVPTDRKWELKCPTHGKWLVSHSNHVSRASGCPKCASSIGHELVREVLQTLDVDFVEEAKVRGGGRLRFDFSLPSFSLLIEYDGMQHFRPIDLFGGESAFKRQRLRDRRKKELARKNGYKLLRVTYRQSASDIARIIATACGKTPRNTTLTPRRLLRRHVAARSRRKK